MKWYPNFLLIFWPAKCRTVTQLSTVFQERNGSIIVINFVYLPYVYLTVRSIDWCNKMFSRDSSFFFLCKCKFDFVDDCSYQRSHFACWLKEPMKQSVEKHEVSLTKMLLSASGRNTACTSMVPAIVPAFETFKVKSFLYRLYSWHVTSFLWFSPFELKCRNPLHLVSRSSCY